MREANWGVAVLILLVACDADDAPADAGTDASLDGSVDGSIEGGTDGALPDGGLPDDERPATLSPLACQTDLEILAEEDFEVRRHPLDHKGEIFGIRNLGPELTLVELGTGRELARSGQTVPGFDDQTLTLRPTEIAVAPDYGIDNSPDYPLAFDAFMSGTGDVLFRAALDGSLVKVVAEGEMVRIAGDTDAISGVVDVFSQIRVAAQGTVMFVLQLEGSRNQYVVQERGPGAPLRLVVGVGTSVDDTYRVKTIEAFDLVESPLVRVGLATSPADDAPQVGFAYLRGEGGEQQCVLTDTALPCPGGVSIPAGERVAPEDFASDGFSTGAIFRGTPSNPSLRYRAGGNPGGRSDPAVIERGVEVQGFTFNNVKHPRACERDGSLFFVGQLDADTMTPHDELMRIDGRGTLTQLTDFGSLLGSEALLGEVPDEILGVALGYGCDAVLRTTGSPKAGETNPYEGYWVSYYQGDTMEVIDETPGRSDNGNGVLSGVTRGRSGLDPNAEWNTPHNMGPTGDFTFLAQRPSGPGQSVHARATRPRDRCRAPNIINSDGDADDVAPGDGRCDTGAMVGSDPECTMRAMIQETNALPGSDLARVDGPRTIRVESPLPPITSALVFEGDATVLDGSALTGEEVGLQVDVRGVELNGLRIEGFPSHGLRASEYVQLLDVWASSNCGWGLWLEVGGSIQGTVEDPARFENNGAGDTCAAGGVYLDGDNLITRMSYVRANANDGPGIASRGPIDTTGLEASDNRGDGVTVDLDASTQNAIYAGYGTITASDNVGHGLLLVGGSIKTVLANIVAERNCGFGLSVEFATALLESRYGRMPGSRHVMSDNGRTPAAGGGGRFFEFDGAELQSVERPCGGGGISITALDPDGLPTINRIDSVDIEENQGPGIASTTAWRLGDATISANYGPGILIESSEDEDEAAHHVAMVRFASGRPQSVVSDNLAFGVEVVSGSVVVEGDLLMEANSGAAIALIDGDVRLNTEPLSFRTVIRRNGRSGLGCQLWRNMDSVWTRTGEGPCEDGGVYTESGNIDAGGPIVRDNEGPGLSASDPEADGDYGIITVTGGEVCGNGAPDVAETMNYMGVTTVCGG